ncbi:Protein aurora borealis [Gryllus bimaculatus]|nr:Protein aurora borealis [Gryllus bimaculatus]
MDNTRNVEEPAERGKQTTYTNDNFVRTSPAYKKPPNYSGSPSLCETPVRERRLSKICENEVYSPRTREPTPSVPHTKLPVITTPPSRFKNVLVQNPFDESLRKRLHMPFISPTLFTKAISPSQNENFSWSIEDLANLLPAQIDEFQMQSDQSWDEHAEQEAQKNISRFFESNIIVPSPWGTFENYKPLTISDLNESPARPASITMDPVTTVLDFDDQELFPPVKKDAWTQTELTVPIEVLSPFDSLSEKYQIEKEDDETDSDLMNTEKILTNTEIISTIQDDLHCSSPCYNLYKNLLSSTIHTPKNTIIRSFGTPLGRSSVMSPIGLSPIVHSFQQVNTNIELTRDSVENVQCTCHLNGISCDSGISSATSQTDVSFPSILPKGIEEVLKPFQTFIQDQSEMDDVNLNSSLSRRRKLLFSETLDMSVSSIPSQDNGYDSS